MIRVCLKLQLYQIHGNVIYVSMSADASCRGLMSPMDGPIRMEFTEGVSLNGLHLAT